MKKFASFSVDWKNRIARDGKDHIVVGEKTALPVIEFNWQVLFSVADVKLQWGYKQV